MIQPQNAEQLAETLRGLADQHTPIRFGGNFSKDRLGGPSPSGECVSTSAMTRVLQYEPRDLTISVEAGMKFADLEHTLAEKDQMIPLEPAWSDRSTVGGVIGANLSGPRRRLYGTARDMVIGMTFATLEGKLIQSGGMVVKNVAGLDMAKLMIGSFGTLAAVATVNFKLFPCPKASRTFVKEFATVAEAMAERDKIVHGVLQPSAVDVVNWPKNWRLLVRVGGTNAVLARYSKELPSFRAVEGEEEDALWAEIREFTPKFLAANPAGGVVTTSAAMTAMRAALEPLHVPVIVRAASGVIYAHYEKDAPAADLGPAFPMMEKVKEMFDPERLLNRGRLYGRI